MPRFSEMTVPDRIVMFITYLVGFLTVILTVSAIIAAFFQPAAKIGPIVELLANVLTMLVGVIVGYLGGRAVGVRMKNGHGDD